MEIDPQFKKEWIEKSRRASLGMKNRHVFTKEQQSKGGKKSIGRNIFQYHKKHDEILKQLQNKENRVFPSWIIDGFEFSNNDLNIIEIKINTGKLSEQQKKFVELLKNTERINFKIVHGKL